MPTHNTTEDTEETQDLSPEELSLQKRTELTDAVDAADLGFMDAIKAMEDNDSKGPR